MQVIAWGHKVATITSANVDQDFRPGIDLGLICMISNTIIHRTFAGPSGPSGII